MFRTISWQIALPYAALISLSILVFGFLVANQVYQSDLAVYSDFSLRETKIGATLFNTSTWSEDQTIQEEILRVFANISESADSFQLISRDGNLLAASNTAFNPPGRLEDPEVQEAFLGVPSTDIRNDSLHTAAPVSGSDPVQVVLHGIYPLETVNQTAGLIRIASIIAAVLISAATLLLATLISERSFRPIRDLTRTAQEIAAVQQGSGQYPDRDEMSQLTLAFNSMSMQLRSQIDALKTERSKLSTVLQQMSDSVIIADEQGRVQLFNASAEKLFSIDQSEAMGRSLAEVLRDYRLVELWQKCLSTGQEQSLFLEFRQPNLSLQCIATPMESQMPGNILLLIQDLTRLRRLETVRRDFISNLSHELRTPLASLKALAETLQDGALEDPPAARRFLSRMETEVDALSHMVNELLELSRIESGKVPLQLRPTPPLELLRSAQERLLVQAERKELNISLECPADLPEVLVDANRMEQVVVNLLHNAIKFTSPGGKITLSGVDNKEHITFAVKDNGAGIPAEDLPRIFERFYKTDRARSGGGTGLGLAISRHLVEAHGGRIWAESIETRGSTIYFTLMKV